MIDYLQSRVTFELIAVRNCIVAELELAKTRSTHVGQCDKAIVAQVCIEQVAKGCLIGQKLGLNDLVVICLQISQMWEILYRADICKPG